MQTGTPPGAPGTASGALACVRSADGGTADSAVQNAGDRNRSAAANLQRQSQRSLLGFAAKLPLRAGVCRLSVCGNGTRAQLSG